MTRADTRYREDIIRMAREAGFLIDGVQEFVFARSSFHFTDELTAFAALVAAAERKRFAWTQEHWTEYERNIATAAKAEEREVCAKVCDDLAAQDKRTNYYVVAANAIRARSNNDH